ncbi:hypothetical protein M378DRAFT_755257 [Amanita muscaria Koide BX008]|uniref:Uncharacterized protein n=1 Tax=Amanita muscaria (strain Koide BX008) TaxID=946122 RepID=A0A0C2WLW2_AMAMK|nr:hypothetical protein M378DRAFT_755257 [Amanita muscaria Koide BX008]
MHSVRNPKKGKSTSITSPGETRMVILMLYGLHQQRSTRIDDRCFVSTINCLRASVCMRFPLETMTRTPYRSTDAAISSFAQ